MLPRKDRVLPDVDHFLPHVLKQADISFVIDGVWNLVLSCSRCNRGVRGKFDRVPALRLLERLHKRNEFFISSHHPLRETIIGQMGVDMAARREFLQGVYQEARNLLIHEWSPELENEAVF